MSQIDILLQIKGITWVLSAQHVAATCNIDLLSAQVVIQEKHFSA